MLNWGRNWGRDICCECQTAACIGPHQRGKKGSSCRTGWTGPRGSERFRPGTGDLDRSESAIESRHAEFLTLLRGINKTARVLYTKVQSKKGNLKLNHSWSQLRTRTSQKIYIKWQKQHSAMKFWQHLDSWSKWKNQIGANVLFWSKTCP